MGAEREQKPGVASNLIDHKQPRRSHVHPDFAKKRFHMKKAKITGRIKGNSRFSLRSKDEIAVFSFQ